MKQEVNYNPAMGIYEDCLHEIVRWIAKPVSVDKTEKEWCEEFKTFVAEKAKEHYTPLMFYEYLQLSLMQATSENIWAMGNKYRNYVPDIITELKTEQDNPIAEALSVENTQGQKKAKNRKSKKSIDSFIPNNVNKDSVKDKLRKYSEKHGAYDLGYYVRLLIDNGEVKRYSGLSVAVCEYVGLLTKDTDEVEKQNIIRNFNRGVA